MSSPTAILLATYNGAAYLPQQLASIAGQTATWQLIASDDGSTDGTMALLQAFVAAHPGRVTLTDGPRAGFAANFRSLLDRVPPATDRAAFCDQDDVWYPDKLARAGAALEGVPGPGLYAARTRLVDAGGRPIGLSRGMPRPAGFGNALVQNIASGNSMVLNAAAIALMRAASAEARAVPMHDWWAYQLVTGMGGEVVFDDRPALDYRQHGGNQLGAGRGPAALWRRAGRLLAGRSAEDMAAQARALAASAHRFTPENRGRLKAFAEAMAAPDPLRRIRALRRAGIYRQNRRGDALFWAAVALGRI